MKKRFWKNSQSSKQTLDVQTMSEESIGGPRILYGECDNCHICIEVCPVQAISVENSLVIDLGLCIHCQQCLLSCPRHAIDWNNTMSFSSTRSSLLFKENVEERGEELKHEILHKFGRSLFIRVVDAGSCNGCILEAGSLSNPIYDMERFGVKVVASPRHADVLLVCGPVTENMLQGLMHTYEAMANPKIVIAMGSCAISGGMFRDNPECHKGLDTLLPVDVYIPGCPPSSSRMITALRSLLG